MENQVNRKMSGNAGCIRDEMVTAGWSQLDSNDSRAYRLGDTVYCTLSLDSVRLAIAGQTSMSEKRGDVFFCGSVPSDVALLAVIVDEGSRRRGGATEAVKALMSASRKAGCTLFVHASPIEKKSIGKRALQKWYAKMGWKQHTGQIFVSGH